MTKWDSDLSATGNQAKTVKIVDGIGIQVLYSDKNVAFLAFQTEKVDVDTMSYSDYTGYAVHWGGEYSGDVKGINVLAVDEISYPTTQNATDITSISFIANWYKHSDYTYLIDVATDLVFSNILVGYNNLPVINGDTFKLVIGLTSGTDYYYRVRSKSYWGDVSKNSLFKKVTTL